MSDIADNADKEIETNLALDLALQLRRGRVVVPAEWDGKTCVDCGEEIKPPGRAEIGYINCLDCQADKERARQ